MIRKVKITVALIICEKHWITAADRADIVFLYGKDISARKKICKSHCMKYNYILAFNGDSIEITTSKGHWKIIQAKHNKKLELYHKNTEERFSDKFSRISGYHNQRFLGYEMTDYVEYIFSHDGRWRTPPLKGTKRYRSQQKRLAKLERQNSINNVIRLIDSLHVQASS